MRNGRGMTKITTYTRVAAALGVFLSASLNAMAQCECPSAVITQVDRTGGVAWTVSHAGLTSTLYQAASLEGPWQEIVSGSNGNMSASVELPSMSSTPVFLRAGITVSELTRSIVFTNVAYTRGGATKPSYGPCLQVFVTTNCVINTLQEWSNIWFSSSWNHNGDRPDPGAIEGVFDPATQMLIGVFAGTRTDYSHDTVITNILTCNGQMVVQYVEHVPGCFFLPMDSYPSHVVRVPRSEWPVCFTGTAVTNYCP